MKRRRGYVNFAGIFLTVSIVTVAIVSLIYAASYGLYIYNTRADTTEGTGQIFERVADGSQFSIYREKITDVMYVVYHDWRKGGLSVMLDLNGKPLLYKYWLIEYRQQTGETRQ